MLRAIILIIVLVLVLSFFGVSLRHLVEAPTTQSNFSYVGDLITQVWHSIEGILHGFGADIGKLI